MGISGLTEQSTNGNRSSGSSFEFNELMRLGIRFGARRQYEVTIGGQHFSNAGLHPPNDGITYAAVTGAWYWRSVSMAAKHDGPGLPGRVPMSPQELPIVGSSTHPRRPRTQHARRRTWHQWTSAAARRQAASITVRRPMPLCPCPAGGCSGTGSHSWRKRIVRPADLSSTTTFGATMGTFAVDSHQRIDSLRSNAPLRRPSCLCDAAGSSECCALCA